MKNIVLLGFVIGMLATTSQAQVRKCQGPDGKVIYSDVVCADTKAKETTVNTSANTLDHSGLRAQGERIRAQEDAAELASMKVPAQCKFKAYAYGDAKGQALKQQAELECMQNLQAAKQGRPQSTEAYQMWKDHFDQTSANRNAIAAQAKADNNTRQTTQAIGDLGRKIDQAGDRKLTCTRNSLNSDLNCK